MVFAAHLCSLMDYDLVLGKFWLFVFYPLHMIEYTETMGSILSKMDLANMDLRYNFQSLLIVHLHMDCFVGKG